MSLTKKPLSGMSSITSSDGSLTVSGSDIVLNTANPNTWTAPIKVDNAYIWLTGSSYMVSNSWNIGSDGSASFANGQTLLNADGTVGFLSQAIQFGPSGAWGSGAVITLNSTTGAASFATGAFTIDANGGWANTNGGFDTNGNLTANGTANILGLSTLASINYSGTLNGSALTASRILGTDASKNVLSLSTTTYPSLTELAYVKGVTSAIQTQINGKASNTVIASASIVSVSSSPYSIASTDYILKVNTSSALQLNLPNPNLYRRIFVKDVTGSAGTNNITMHRNGSEKIENVAADKILSGNYGSWIFVSDGTDWWMI
jgi:hypothetical protein